MLYAARLRKEGKSTLIEFPDCPGCQSFTNRGEDVHAVAQDALMGWLETHLLFGEAPPKPKARVPAASRLLVRVGPVLAVRLQLRWARQSLGLSQAELARRVGVSRQQISLLESPDANLTLSTLEKVAQSLGMDLAIELLRKPSAA